MKKKEWNSEEGALKLEKFSVFDYLNSPVSYIQPFYGSRGRISHLWELLYCFAWVIWHQMGWLHNHIHVNHNQFHIAGLIISHAFQNAVTLTFPSNTSRNEKYNFPYCLLQVRFHICPPAEAAFWGKNDPGTGCLCLSMPVFHSVSLHRYHCL